MGSYNVMREGETSKPILNMSCVNKKKELRGLVGKIRRLVLLAWHVDVDKDGRPPDLHHRRVVHELAELLVCPVQVIIMKRSFSSSFSQLIPYGWIPCRGPLERPLCSRHVEDSPVPVIHIQGRATEKQR